MTLQSGWTPACELPLISLVVTHSVSQCHAFSCPKGAMPTLRYNAIRDITAQLITEACPNVGVEPLLQPQTGELFRHRTENTDDHARLDIRAQNFWDKSRRSTFSDVSVFNPHAPTNCTSTTSACYRNMNRRSTGLTNRG